MPNGVPVSREQDNYDPRWFIWTIVFLFVTGISLVSYILLSDTGYVDNAMATPHKVVVQKK